MEVEYIITEDEYVKANKLFSKPTRRILIFYVITVILLVVVAVFGHTFVVKLAAAGGIVGGVLGHLIVRHIYAPWRTRRQYRSYQAAQELVSVTARTESLFFKSKIGEATIEWSRIVKWRENEDFLLIYQASEVYHIIPKRVGEIVDRLRDSLSKYVGKKT